ncbi:MAG TPA: hypothetical protein PLY26_04460, partial [Ferruginibacter sp.]|nr:hypothetical protein [Ferruginibacter sp.]
MEKLLLSIYQFYHRRKPALYGSFFLLLLLFGWFASRVHFEEDISKILPKDKKIEKLNEVFQN